MGTAIAVASSFLSNGNWETSDGVTSNKTKVLAYLGQLRSNEFVRGRKLVFDLSLRYRTAQKTLELLVVRGLVDKKIETRNGTIALYRINPSIAVILPEWSANYGRHPYGT